MADIGLNQNVSIRNRKFHFQTATNIEDGIIRTEVFEQGRLMYAQDNRYERRGSSNSEGGESRLRHSLNQFHRSIITSLKVYFDISDILQTVDNAVSHYRLGAILLSLHIFDKCQKHLLKCIALDPKFYSAHIALARCYFYQKNYKDAEEILQTLVKNEISYPDLFNLLGMVMLEQKNYIQCLNHFRHAVKLNQKYKEAYFNIAAAIFKRISYLRTQDKGEDVQKNLDFLNVILHKIDKVGNDDDRAIVGCSRKGSQLPQSLCPRRNDVRGDSPLATDCDRLGRVSLHGG